MNTTLSFSLHHSHTHSTLIINQEHNPLYKELWANWAYMPNVRELVVLAQWADQRRFRACPWAPSMLVRYVHPIMARW